MASSIEARDPFTVRGLVAVVTGGGIGIGLMIARALEANGAIVYVIGRRKEVLDNAASTTVRTAPSVTQVHSSLAIFAHKVLTIAETRQHTRDRGGRDEQGDLSRAAGHLKARHGYVNVVVANSGVAGPSISGFPQDASLSEFRSHLWGWDSDAFTDTYAVNTTAVFSTLVAFLELLDESNKRGNLGQRSQFIATSSIGAYNRTCLSGYAYDSSKAAVVHMVKQLPTGLVPYGIRANVIAPGLYPSEMTGYHIDMGEKDGWSKQFITEQRPGSIQDIAGVILFLTSKAGAYVNGNVLLTEGGRLGIIPSTY
ncbi:hypothetical protein DL766_000766 [Monosporascus sp. MC13-8B]|nr:hypothetical protein DL766_000766 [Monosporascus sp. MC13-8B]